MKVEEFTLEFDGVKREIVTSWKVVCRKWGDIRQEL